MKRKYDIPKCRVIRFEFENMMKIEDEGDIPAPTTSAPVSQNQAIMKSLYNDNGQVNP